MRVHKNRSQKEMFSFINVKEELLAGKGEKSGTEMEFRTGLFRRSDCVGGDELPAASMGSITAVRETGFLLRQGRRTDHTSVGQSSQLCCLGPCCSRQFPPSFSPWGGMCGAGDSRFTQR